MAEQAPLSLAQAEQELNNISRLLGLLIEAIEAFQLDTQVEYSLGVNLTDGTPTTVFTATTTQTIVGVKVSSSDGALGTATVDWVDDSSGDTINQIEGGLVSPGQPLQLEGPLVLNVDDTLVVTGAANQDVTITWREAAP